MEKSVWATSCSRGWLNNYFMQTAFTHAESRRVLLSDYVHPHNRIRINRQGWGTNATRIHGDWGLRSPNKYGTFAYILDYQTIYWTAGDIWCDGGGSEGDVRPAMWIEASPA